MKSYTVQQPHMGINCKENKYALLNLGMVDNHNDVVIANSK